MEKQQVYIGSILSGTGGLVKDSTKKVKFVGELVGHYAEPGFDRSGALSDTRGTYEKLFKLADGRLLAHVEHWSHWAGEETAATLHLVEEKDLRVGGRFELLGSACGYGRALTLEEALAGVAPGAFGDLVGEVTCIVTDPETLVEAAELAMTGLDVATNILHPPGYQEPA